jgi:hypothetical protein
MKTGLKTGRAQRWRSLCALESGRRRHLALPVLQSLLLLAFVCCDVLSGQDLAPLQYRPTWQIGQKWVVETVCHQSQARRDVKKTTPSKPVRWQFEVSATEVIEGADCYKVLVKCLVPGKQPEIVLWVDQASMTLRRIQTGVPTPNGIQVVTESYRSDSGQPFPACPPLSVPPLELPYFVEGAKGTQTYTYSASDASDGSKDLGDIGFSFVVQQDVGQASDEEALALTHQAYMKSIVKQPTLEIRLKSATHRVRQLWQPGSPWPVYSRSGVTESRLVQVQNRGQQ